MLSTSTDTTMRIIQTPITTKHHTSIMNLLITQAFMIMTANQDNMHTIKTTNTVLITTHMVKITMDMVITTLPINSRATKFRNTKIQNGQKSKHNLSNRNGNRSTILSSRCRRNSTRCTKTGLNTSTSWTQSIAKLTICMN